MKPREWLGLAVLGGVGYWAYLLLTKATNAAGAAAQSATSGIANAYVGITNWLYGSSAITPTGNVILPNGQKVPLSQLSVTWDSTNNVANFTYLGVPYIIPPNPSGGPAYDQNGDYHAQ
jgi:hypothetical protein